jgi:hypothetical protein
MKPFIIAPGPALTSMYPLNIENIIVHKSACDQLLPSRITVTNIIRIAR